MLPLAKLGPQRRPFRLAPREVTEEAVLVARESRGDERRLDSRRAGKHRDRNATLERCRDEASAGIVDTREPCIRHERDPLSRRDARQELLAASRFVVVVVADGTSAGADLVRVEQYCRVPWVLNEDVVRFAELGQDTERDVFEVADRRRADREWHDATVLRRAPRSPRAQRRSGQP